ncbi:helix-turn-helix transcriptional regulator [Micromonospora sp. CP22]|uniref:helix-turn-helix domain-containing protein n=1 Tax=Micromonospora sp. CP22 TaxID=2580517 RepID=UPI00281510CB|nr:helix-turn-helix transcriptional regulator [Micromonospora sp. CP22]
MDVTTGGQGPTTNRRRLRLVLRQLRLDRGLSLEDVRQEMDWSLSKVTRIENGSVSISVNDLRALLDFYQVRDAGQVRDLLGLARLARRRHWAAEYREYVSASYMDFLGYEDDSWRISQYHPFLIPGLLQTKRYAQLVVTIGPRYRGDEAAADARVQLRLARQARVFAQPQREVRIVLDERALKSVENTQLMLEQVEHILFRLPDHLHVVVLGRDTAANSALVGPFSLHEFEWDVDPDVVYLDALPDDVALVEDEAAVAGYKASFEDLYRQAAKGDDAQRLLEEIRGSLRVQASA